MIHFKNHNPGFTFFEVIAALFIFGMVLSSVLVLQQNSFALIVKSSRSLMASLNLKSLIGQNSMLRIQGKSRKNEEKIESLGMTLQYKEENPSEKSALKRVKNIRMQKGTASWQEGRRDTKETLINIFYEPEKQKS